MKKRLFLAVFLLIIQSAAFSQTVYDDNYTENPNYLKGAEYLQNSQYSSAISEFKKALRADPSDESALIGLSNAYNLRAQYYSRAKETAKALSDVKSALFFNKYFKQSGTGISEQAVNQMEKNLKVLEQMEVSPDETARRARASRVKGEFAASGYDYFRLASNPVYKEEAGSALGDIFKIFNRPDKAIIFYQNALASNPKNAGVHLKLARAYEDINDFNSSVKEYTYALNAAETGSGSEKEDILNSLEKIWQKKSDENPNDAEAHANLGVIYQKQKRYFEALNEYRKAETMNSGNINTKINIGALYQEQKNYLEALNMYNEVLMLQPKNLNVLAYKAECLKALNKQDEAADTYRAILQINPGNRLAEKELFQLKKNSMSSEEILAYMHKNLLSNPNDPALYYEFAYELHKAGKIDDAINYYKQSITLDKNNIDAYINLSQCLRQKKNYPEASSVIRKAAELAPDNPLIKSQINAVNDEYYSVIYNRAAELYQNGRYNEAVEMYSQIQPESAESNIGTAVSYHALGNDVKAVEHYKKAMAFSPDNADIPYYIAALYADMNDISNAEKYAKEALAKNPFHPQAKELSAYISSKQTETMLEEAVKVYEDEKYAEAAAMFEKIASVNPNEASVYYYTALSYDALKNYKKAISSYETAVRLQPQLNIAYYSIAVDYDNLKNYNSAKQYYKKYIESINDDNEYKQYAKKRLEELAKK